MISSLGTPKISFKGRLENLFKSNPANVRRVTRVVRGADLSMHFSENRKEVS